MVPEYLAMRGDTVKVFAGPYTGSQGTATFVDHEHAEVTLLVEWGETTHPDSTIEGEPANGLSLIGHHLTLPLSHVTMEPPLTAVKFTAEKGYDVKAGDEIVVARGPYLGEHYVVKGTDLRAATVTLQSWPYDVRSYILARATPLKLV